MGQANDENDQIAQLTRDFSNARQKFSESRSHVSIARYIHEHQKVLQMQPEKGMDEQYKMLEKLMEEQQPEIQQRLISYLQGEPGFEE